uniref:Uncharacterized protein n=1 Tax=Peronospora matthiolae TaxID=2874970 RepID=A0AAV1VHD0_9STRA
MLLISNESTRGQAVYRHSLLSHSYSGRAGRHRGTIARANGALEEKGWKTRGRQD